MFTPAKNMQIDENALKQIAKYLKVPVDNIQELMVRNYFFGTQSELVFSQDGFVYGEASAERVVWFQVNCFRDDNALGGFYKTLDIVMYKTSNDIRGIPVE